jgi:hypothetical protein
MFEELHKHWMRFYLRFRQPVSQSFRIEIQLANKENSQLFLQYFNAIWSIALEQKFNKSDKKIYPYVRIWKPAMLNVTKAVVTGSLEFSNYQASLDFVQTMSTALYHQIPLILYDLTDKPTGVYAKHVDFQYNVDWQLENMDIASELKARIPHDLSDDCD